MIPAADTFPFRRVLLSAACAGAVYLLAPWPGPQGIFHVVLVLGLAPGYRSPLVAALWAAGAGWLLEGGLRIYPHLGGTPLADMGACLLAQALLHRVPPQSVPPFWGRMAAFVAGHALLVHLCVKIAAGPHAWGTGWLWALLTIPLWAGMVMKLGVPQPRR